MAAGLESLAWLGDECGLADGMLRLPGHRGRHRDEPAPGPGTSSRSMRRRSSRPSWLRSSSRAIPSTVRARRRAFDWFLGRNRLDRPLYDFATGGCSDGLGDDDLNANEGAESTLAFHRAQLLLDAAGLPVVLRTARHVSGEGPAA